MSPHHRSDSATLVWTGTNARRSGAVTGASGSLGPLDVDRSTRIGEADGKTSTEELAAAAPHGEAPGANDEAFTKAPVEAEQRCLVPHVLTDGTTVQANGGLA